MNMFSPMCISKAEEIAAMVAGMAAPDAIDVLNKVRQILHESSPFRGEPIDCVLWVPSDKVRANDYNPNTVAPPEMRLLEESSTRMDTRNRWLHGKKKGMRWWTDFTAPGWPRSPARSGSESWNTSR